MTALQSRQNFRAALSNPTSQSPASVYDPISARAAESAGYKLGMLAGSVASMSTLAAPDLIVTTMTEVADQVRRITRVCGLGLLVDADHGYGNALNVYRTIEELEHSGAACVSIEDTLLPQSFGAESGGDKVISTAEMVGKLRAAIAARRDPEFAIAGRTSSLRVEGLNAAIERARAYRTTGIDALFVVGLETLDQVQALHEAAGLPIIAGAAPKSGGDRSALANAGVALLLQGHQPIAVAAKALFDVYSALYRGMPPAELREELADQPTMDDVTRAKHFGEMRAKYLSAT